MITLTTIAIGSVCIFALIAFLLNKLSYNPINSLTSNPNSDTGKAMLVLFLAFGGGGMGWFAIEYISNFTSIAFQQTTVVKAAEIFNAIAAYYIAMRGFMLWVSLFFIAFILFVIGAIIMWVFNISPDPMLNFFHIR